MSKKDIEAKVYKKYRQRVVSFVKNKYKKISELELRNKKIYLEKGSAYPELKKIKSEIYKSYAPIIEMEIREKLAEVLNSESYESALKAEEIVQRKRLHYKALKDYQNFPITIPDIFIDLLYNEVNSNLANNENIIEKEELKYLTFLSMYAIIDSIRKGFKIKLGTCLKIWADKRDVRVNLPDFRNRIMSDRLIPKVELCKNFGYRYFQKINQNNEAIINYYQAKMERYLILLKIKKGGVVWKI